MFKAPSPSAPLSRAVPVAVFGLAFVEIGRPLPLARGSGDACGSEGLTNGLGKGLHQRWREFLVLARAESLGQQVDDGLERRRLDVLGVGLPHVLVRGGVQSLPR